MTYLCSNTQNNQGNLSTNNNIFHALSFKTD